MRFRTTANKTGAAAQACLGLCVTILQLLQPARADGAAEALELLASMEATASAITDYTKLVEKTERLVNGDVTHQIVFIKYRQPGQFYMKVLEGNDEGGELIYPAREGSTAAVAHAGGFKGGLARFLVKTRILSGMVPTEFELDAPEIGKWQHHAAPETSFQATIERIASNLRTAIDRNEGAIALQRDCQDGARCRLRLEFELPPAAGQWHEVQDGESLWTIASDYGQPMYVVWYANPEVRKPRKVRPGQALFIPSYYAARGSVWVSEETLLPTRIEIFDAQGRLYERYDYSEVRIDVGLGDADFDTGNPEYRFLEK